MRRRGLCLAVRRVRVLRRVPRSLRRRVLPRRRSRGGRCCRRRRHGRRADGGRIGVEQRRERDRSVAARRWSAITPYSASTVSAKAVARARSSSGAARVVAGAGGATKGLAAAADAEAAAEEEKDSAEAPRAEETPDPAGAAKPDAPCALFGTADPPVQARDCGAFAADTEAGAEAEAATSAASGVASPEAAPSREAVAAFANVVATHCAAGVC